MVSIVNDSMVNTMIDNNRAGIFITTYNYVLHTICPGADAHSSILVCIAHSCHINKSVKRLFSPEGSSVLLHVP